MPEKNIQNIEIKDIGNSEVEITVEIPAEEFESYRREAVKKLGQTIDVPGFRKGNVPEAVLEQKIGAGSVLHEMAEQALRIAYPAILREHKIDAIGRPEVVITKIAAGNPLGMKITTAVMPDVSLPDYKKAAQNVGPTLAIDLEVSDKELEDVLLEVRKNIIKTEDSSSSIVKQPQEKEESGILGPDGKPINQRQENTKEASQEAPQELSDEVVKKLGNFENVSQFKEKIRENLREEKKVREKEKRRLEILDAILKDVKISVPRIMIESEQQKMLAEFKGNIAGMGIKPEEYLEKLQKTEEDLKKEWENDAIKRVKTYLTLHKIAEEEKITVKDDELEKEADRFLEYHKDVDRNRAKNYLFGLLLNEKVFQFLEGSFQEDAQEDTKS